MNEQVRDIHGYNGDYQVSNTGKVYSLKTGKRKPLTQGKHDWGYLKVCLSKNNKIKNAYVHRLIMDAFSPMPEPGYEINHRDGNKQNNNILNLEWCSRQQNIDHEFSTLRGFSPVVAISKASGLMSEFPTIAEACRRTGANRSAVDRSGNIGKLYGRGRRARYWIGRIEQYG
jgi:DUF971 family protein